MAIDLESGHSYRVLQVDPHADLTVIRAAYRARAGSGITELGCVGTDSRIVGKVTGVGRRPTA
jgi:hypothetical protein